MFSIASRLCLALCFLSLLAACGGSSGGSSRSAIPFSSFDELTDNGVVEIEGHAATASFTIDRDTNTLLLSVPSEFAGSTIQLTREDGEYVAFEIQADGSQVAFDATTGDIIRSEFGLIFGSSEENDMVAGLTRAARDVASAEFQHQTLGIWMQGMETGNGSVGTGSFGARTSVGNLPTTQTATYNGTGNGYVRQPDGQGFLAISEVVVTTDFSTAAITSSDTTLATLTGDLAITDAPELDFSGSGPVSGAGFSATVSGGSVSGHADGAFYGPNAEEVGGTYRLTGSGGLDYIGAFGAK